MLWHDCMSELRDGSSQKLFRNRIVASDNKTAMHSLGSIDSCASRGSLSDRSRSWKNIEWSLMDELGWKSRWTCWETWLPITMRESLPHAFFSLRKAWPKSLQWGVTYPLSSWSTELKRRWTARAVFCRKCFVLEFLPEHLGSRSSSCPLLMSKFSNSALHLYQLCLVSTGSFTLVE